jgi:hypothetical protein
MPQSWDYATVGLTVNGILIHEPASLDQWHALNGCVVGSSVAGLLPVPGP